MPESERSHETTVDQIQRTLVRRILRRVYPPGSNLPPVRALATEFGVTAPTIQRVVAGLEAHRLVEARHGSGVKVLDAFRNGGLSLLPLWFVSLVDEPSVAARIFAESMELRRLVATYLAGRLMPNVAAPPLAVALAAVREARSTAELMEADLGFTRAILETANHFGATALFNTVEAVLRDVPLVAEAVYGDPDLVRASLEDIVGAVALGGDAGVAAIGAALERWDVEATRRFEALARAARDGAR